MWGIRGGAYGGEEGGQGDSAALEQKNGNCYPNTQAERYYPVQNALRERRVNWLSDKHLSICLSRVLPPILNP